MMDASEVWELFFQTHLILDIQTTLSLQKPYCKNFWWNYNKNESCKCYLGNKEQKWMLPVVSRIDVYIDFDFAHSFYACSIGRAILLAHPKNRVRRGKFVQPCSEHFKHQLRGTLSKFSRDSKRKKKICNCENINNSVLGCYTKL